MESLLSKFLDLSLTFTSKLWQELTIYGNYIPYTYKFSRYVIFAVFAVDLLSAKFSSSKYIEGMWNDCYSQISELLHCSKYN